MIGIKYPQMTISSPQLVLSIKVTPSAHCTLVLATSPTLIVTSGVDKYADEQEQLTEMRDVCEESIHDV